MGLLDRLSLDREDAEQLAASDADPAMRGENRSQTTQSGFLVSTFGGLRRIARPTTTTTLTDDDDDDLESVRVGPPENLADNHDDYFHDTSFTRAGLKIFALTVTEPGYQIDATIERETGETDDDGNPITETATDEEMNDALDEWASQCAITAAESRADFSTILKQAPIERYSKGTGFIEKIGTHEDPDAIAALAYHKPETFTQYLQQNKNLLIQPDDEVEAEHPRTPDGDAAAYVQYDDASPFADFEGDGIIAFAADDLIKLTFDPDTGDAWGTSIWEACGDRIDALFQKFNDRDSSIRTVGHQHRIYSGEWTQQEAKEYADAHKKGEVSAGPNVEDYSNDREGYRGSWAGRVDFVPQQVDVKAVPGEVADIADAVKDDIEAIFSVLPTAKPKIGYASDINQFVIEPLDETDARLVDEERQYLERTFEPLFEAVAGQLAGGSYEGDVSFGIQPSGTHPLDREDFPAENLTALGGFLKDYMSSGVSEQLPLAAVLDQLGYDTEELREEYDDAFSIEDLAPESQYPETDEQTPPENAPPSEQEAVADGGTEETE